ncbi:MAG: TonB-dependent receptor [Vicinamibacterales bacterium]
MNTILAVSGKQTPDTPHVLAKLGAVYTVKGLGISPTVRFVDDRYADALNTQLVPSYTVTDLNLSYGLQSLPGLSTMSSLHGLTLSLSAQNLFDRQYVAVIGAFEDATTGSFFVGARRTVAMRVGVAFGR